MPSAWDDLSGISSPIPPHWTLSPRLADLGRISGQRPTRSRQRNATLQRHKANVPTSDSSEPQDRWAQRMNQSERQGPTTSWMEQHGTCGLLSTRLRTEQPVPAFASSTMHLDDSPARLFGLLGPLWVGGGGWCYYSVGLSGGDM